MALGLDPEFAEAKAMRSTFIHNGNQAPKLTDFTLQLEQ
jgi:hypothetical protein